MLGADPSQSGPRFTILSGDSRFRLTLRRRAHYGICYASRRPCATAIVSEQDAFGASGLSDRLDDAQAQKRQRAAPHLPSWWKGDRSRVGESGMVTREVPKQRLARGVRTADCPSAVQPAPALGG
jgi:hypothetical protein